jgi:hypothetical protein
VKFSKLLEGYIQNKEENTDHYIQPIIERWSKRNFFRLSHCF